MKKLFKLLSLVLTLCFMVGCQDKAAMAELEEFKAQAAVEEQNEAFIKNFIEELNKGNTTIVEEVCAPDFVFYQPSNAPEPMNREQTIEFMLALFKAFPDANYNIKELFAVGDRVILRYIFTGTHEGEIQGIPPTGNKVEISSIVIYRIQNGKIVEEREESDMLGGMMQLGMELKPKEGEK
jgi:steroid delta-isomerase-like uncharacterized protein